MSKVYFQKTKITFPGTTVSPTLYVDSEIDSFNREYARVNKLRKREGGWSRHVDRLCQDEEIDCLNR